MRCAGVWGTSDSTSFSIEEIIKHIRRYGLRKKIASAVAVFLCTVTACVLTPAAGAAPLQSALSIRWENDTFGGTDANYTNGVSLAITRPESGLLGGVWSLLGADEGRRSTIYEITQLQFTPADLSRSIPDPNDRPYAGLTYLGCISHLERENSLQSLKLIAGIIGPESGAEATQRIIHHQLNQITPKGWALQLGNEAVINLDYEYRKKYRFSSPAGGLDFELIPMGGAFLGTYLVQAQSEILFRVGYHLPDDFGATSLRGIGYLPLPQPRQSWETYSFLRAGANLVLRNLTLDGNTFVPSRSVDKNIFVPVVEFGAALVSREFIMTASYQLWGHEFASQSFREGYGAILISHLF